MFALINEAGNRGAWTQTAITELDKQSYAVYDCPNDAIAERIVSSATRLESADLTPADRLIEGNIIRLAYKFRV